MFVATMETSSFQWMAFGSTEQRALEAVAAGWDAHRASCPENEALPTGDAVVFGLNGEDDHYEISVERVRPGVCLRDWAEVSEIPDERRPPFVITHDEFDELGDRAVSTLFQRVEGHFYGVRP